MHSLPASAIDRLHAGLAGLGLDPALAAPLQAYLALLLQWNRAYNLTAVRDPDEMVTRHLLDSLAIVPHLTGCAKVVDIGTGAGLPGIPLALALPDLHVTLVETVGKKARFLREAVRLLDLAPRVRVLEMRGEQVAEPDAHDCLVARALGTLAMLLATGGHLIRPGGRLLAMKGQRPDEEIAALPAGWRLGGVIPLVVPGLAAERHLIVVERVRDPVAA